MRFWQGIELFRFFFVQLFTTPCRDSFPFFFEDSLEIGERVPSSGLPGVLFDNPSCVRLAFPIPLAIPISSQCFLFISPERHYSSASLLIGFLRPPTVSSPFLKPLTFGLPTWPFSKLPCRGLFLEFDLTRPKSPLGPHFRSKSDKPGKYFRLRLRCSPTRPARRWCRLYSRVFLLRLALVTSKRAPRAFFSEARAISFFVESMCPPYCPVII